MTKIFFHPNKKFNPAFFFYIEFSIQFFFSKIFVGPKRFFDPKIFLTKFFFVGNKMFFALQLHLNQNLIQAEHLRPCLYSISPICHLKFWPPSHYLKFVYILDCKLFDICRWSTVFFKSKKKILQAYGVYPRWKKMEENTSSYNSPMSYENLWYVRAHMINENDCNGDVWQSGISKSLYRKSSSIKGCLP